MCVFCLFTPFLSVLLVFHRKNSVLLHLINRSWPLQVSNFGKGKTLWMSISVNYSFNTESCCEHIKQVVLTNLCECVSLLAPGCAVCLCVYVCVCVCVCVCVGQNLRRG